MEKNSDRHAQMEMTCECCGKLFMSRVERVRKGLGRFCSLKCWGEKQKENNPKACGIENGKKYWDGKTWITRWYDDEGKAHTTTFARWWWEWNVGKIDNDYCITFKDGNRSNVEPSNLECVPIKTSRARGGSKQKGKPKPSLAREKSKWWRGGSSYEGYPTEFSKPLKTRIKIRDNYTCQACHIEYKSPDLDVHHIDHNVKNNDESNLVTLCRSCHSAVHGKSDKTNGGILYYRTMVLGDWESHI